MAIMVAEIAAMLQTGGIGTIGATTGWSIRVAEIPDAPDTCVSLFEFAGSPSDISLDGARDVNPSLQIKTRGDRNGHIVGREKAEAIALLLDGVGNTTIGTHVYKYIFANHQPAFLGLDENQRPTWVQNFRMSKTP